MEPVTRVAILRRASLVSGRLSQFNMPCRGMSMCTLIGWLTTCAGNVQETELCTIFNQVATISPSGIAKTIWSLRDLLLPFESMHSAGHGVIGGDGLNLLSSLDDPAFSQYHALAAGAFWIWLALHPHLAKHNQWHTYVWRHAAKPACN